MTASPSPSAEVDVPTSTWVRALAGTSPEPLLVFQAGFEVGPFTVGTRGDWSLRAGGVEPCHARLWFDGQRLLASTAAADAPAFVDGQRLRPDDWTHVRSGARIVLGDAQLSVECTRAVTATPPAAARPSVTARVRALVSRRVFLVGLALTAPLLGAALVAVDTGTARSDSRATPRPSVSSSTSENSRSMPEASVQPPSPAREAAHEPAHRPLPLSTRELEERAALAVLRGNLTEAAELYSQLAATNPGSMVFETARAISTRRAAAANHKSSATSFGGTVP